MSKKVLVNGRITKVERCENRLNDGTVVNMVKLTYKFEYDGIFYEGNAMESIGVNSEDMPVPGSLIEIYFYPDTKKWLRKENNEKSHGMTKFLKFLFIILAACSVYILLEPYNEDDFIRAVASVFYTAGIVILLNEILFCMEKMLGRYRKVSATFKRYEISHNGNSISYHKIYILNDTGELYRSPYGISVKGRMEEGEEVFLYRHINTSAIREKANFLVGMGWFVIGGFMGTMIIMLFHI